MKRTIRSLLHSEKFGAVRLLDPIEICQCEEPGRYVDGVPLAGEEYKKLRWTVSPDRLALSLGRASTRPRGQGWPQDPHEAAGRVGAGAGVEVEPVEAHAASEAASMVGEAHGSQGLSRNRINKFNE